MPEEAPLVINVNAVKRVYQDVVDYDEDGNEVAVKMQSTPAFRAKFNQLVFDTLCDCIAHAKDQGRNTLWPEDVPTLEGEEDD